MSYARRPTKEDMAAAHRAAATLRAFYAARGEEINLVIDKHGQITTKFSSARAINEPPALIGEPGVKSQFRPKILALLKSAPGKWFRIDLIHRHVGGNAESLQVTLWQMRKQGLIKKRHARGIPRDCKRPRIEYAYIEGTEE